ncbi:MAG TPA: hypothetical protein VIO83_10680 [Pseudomonas sp.]
MVVSYFPEPHQLLDEVLKRGRLSLVDDLQSVFDAQMRVMPALRSALQLCLNEVVHNDRVRAAQEILAFHCDFFTTQRNLLEEQIVHFARVMGLLQKIAIEAAKGGELRDGVRPDAWALIIGLTLSGAIRLCVMQRTDDGRLACWSEATRALDEAFSFVAPGPRHRLAPSQRKNG